MSIKETANDKVLYISTPLKNTESIRDFQSMDGQGFQICAKTLATTEYEFTVVVRNELIAPFREKITRMGFKELSGQKETENENNRAQ